MALPNSISNVTPAQSDLPSTLGTQIRNLKTAIEDILGIPDATSISAALFGVIAAGLKNVQFQDAAADPATAGYLQRNAGLLKFYDGTAARTLLLASGTATTSRVQYATATGVIGDSANLTFDGTYLSLSGSPTSNLHAATKLYVDTISPIPSGTVVVFFQAAAPTGWTQSASHNDKALRVVSGAGGGGGGTQNFTSLFAAGTVTGGHALTTPELAAHTHTLTLGVDSGAGGTLNFFDGNSSAGSQAPSTSSVGSGTAHTHPMALDVKYIDCIIASKN